MSKVFIDTNVFNFAVLKVGKNVDGYESALQSRALFQSIVEGRNSGFYPVDVESEIGNTPDRGIRDLMLELLKVVSRLSYDPVVDKISDFLIQEGVLTANHRQDAEHIAYSIG